MSLGAKHQVIAAAPNACLRWCRSENGTMLYFIAGDLGAAGAKNLSGLHLSPVKAWEDALDRLTDRMAQAGGAA